MIGNDDWLDWLDWLDLICNDVEELKKVEKRLRKKLRQIALLEEKMVKEELE